jgi:signal peptidase I
MHDDDGTLRLLERTPPGLPQFDPRLDPVARRSRSIRTRALAGRGALGLGLAAAVVGPVLVLAGLLGGPGSGSLLSADGSHALKLIKYYEPSEAMSPTVRVGQTVLVDTAAYEGGRVPETGDVILLTWHSQGHTFPMLKRVIGLPGQTVVIERGVVFVDGHRLHEPYLNHERDYRDYGPYRVLPGHLFVLGDNRINSNDSRYGLGQIPAADAIGKVVGASPQRGTPPTAAVVSGPTVSP